MGRFKALVVLVHGIESPLSSHDTMRNVRIALLQQASSRDTFVLTSRASKAPGKTLDGIDTCGERLVAEIEECLGREDFAPSAVQLSFVGHSLGGLIARFAIGLMHQRRLLDRLRPVSYVAVASPHLGVRRASTWLGSLQERAGEALYGRHRTMDQLMMRDTDDARPLLVRLSAGPFLEGLLRFPARTLVSAVQFDHQVTHSSSSITRFNQFNVRGSLYRYAMSFVSSRYHDRLAGFSGFPQEYESVLAYHASAKRHDAVVRLGSGASATTLTTYSRHASSFRQHPHEADSGDPEIAHDDPLVLECLKNLSVVEWRRMDFEVNSMFAHDTLVASPTLWFCGVTNPTSFGWKVLVKIAKVMAIDRERAT